MDPTVEIPEIVGSVDLRGAFNSGPIKGVFFINGVPIDPFEASTAGAVIEQINRHSERTYVSACVDENYHLVLEARSPDKIRLRAAPPAAGEEPSDILGRLGLKENDGASGVSAAVHGCPPGVDAETRHYARHRRAIVAGAIPGDLSLMDEKGRPLAGGSAPSGGAVKRDDSVHARAAAQVVPPAGKPKG